MQGYLRIRFVLFFIFLTIMYEDCFCESKNNVLTRVVKELCVNIPHGIYTFSIVQTEFAQNDSTGRLWRNELNFKSVGRYYNHLINRCNDKQDERLLDYFCLIDTIAPVSKNTMSACIYPFETEQIITGHIGGIFKNVDNFVLKVFIPSIGDIQEIIVPGNRFRLEGLDFCDGTLITLQATRNNGSDNSLQLDIDSLQYPNISVKNYHIPFMDERRLETAKQYSSKGCTISKLRETIELPEVVAKGRHIKPMNRMGFEPDRTIGENDSLLELVQTMEVLVSRFGLSRGYGIVKEASDAEEEILIEALGHRARGTFIPCEVMLNDDLVRGYSLTDILYINPLDIKQMEYFLPSNYEMFGNLADGSIKGLYGAASRRGLLMIWTKSPTAFTNYKHDKPLSVATLRQLGYMPQKMFDVKKTAFTSPTKYWNPYFSPQNFDWNILKYIDFIDSTSYTITIEGISDEGVPISNQITVCL